MNVEQYVYDMDFKDVHQCINDWLEFQTKGDIGDCLLREVTEKAFGESKAMQIHGIVTLCLERYYKHVEGK